jgi:M6 family metalloprotease-like protein
MSKMKNLFSRKSPLWIGALLLPAVLGFRTLPAADVVLSDARFNGLTGIEVKTNVNLYGIDASRIALTKPDGTRIPADRITRIKLSAGGLSIGLKADTFGRTTALGTTIATTAFGRFNASRPVEVVKPGEPAANGHILGSSSWTDEGWSTSRTDPAWLDPVSGRKGLYRFEASTPDRDDQEKPVSWNDGRVTVPAHQSKNMLVLFVEFPDRRAADAEAPYSEIPPYLEFLRGAVDWFGTSSYGQLRFALSSPQNDRRLGWIMMGKKAAEYPWGGQTHQMFAYIGEACQRAYDQWDIRADEYDMLLIMPAKGTAGLFNGPSNINRDPTDGVEPNTNRVAYVDKKGGPHYVDTGLTAGNDMFRWGYRWLIHEAGHAFGYPDLYMYSPRVNDVRVGSFFYCGGWDMMGNIAGHSTDFLAWHKWKLRWIRDDQVDVVSQSGAAPTRHVLTPVETPGGSKMVVVRTGLSTATVVEFRTRLGINALDERGKYSGVLIYRIDASQWEARDKNPTAQIISKKYYHDPAVGGPKNLTEVWRPVENNLDGYDSPDCCWQPGDVFSDPAAGVEIRVEGISHFQPSDPSSSPYTADDTAVVTVRKSKSADLYKAVVLSNARLKNLTDLTFDTNVELQQRFPGSNANNGGSYTYVREESVLVPESLVIKRADGAVVPADKVIRIKVNPSNVDVTLAPGVFSRPADIAGATVAVKPYYHFGAGAPVPVSLTD